MTPRFDLRFRPLAGVALRVNEMKHVSKRRASALILAHHAGSSEKKDRTANLKECQRTVLSDLSSWQKKPVDQQAVERMFVTTYDSSSCPKERQRRKNIIHLNVGLHLNDSE
jgi:hypothetical protein